MFDIGLAVIKHMGWRTKVREFLDGKGTLTAAQATSDHECDLGKWLYSDGLKKYGEEPEMQSLERAHAALHASVKKIVARKTAGDNAGAEASFKELESHSHEVVTLLKKLDQKLTAKAGT